MAIPDYARTNFNTWLTRRRFRRPRPSRMHRRRDGRAVAHVLCAVGRDSGDYVMTPFGHLAPGNPYDAYLPPETSSGASSAAPA